MNSGRIQAQIPSIQRSQRELLENIAGTVVDGKVHPVRLVTGTPAAATANWGVVTVVADAAGAEWDGWSLLLVDASVLPVSLVVNPVAKTLTYYYTPASSIISVLVLAINASGIFTATAAVTAGDLIENHLGDLTTTLTAGGAALECFPKANKDFVRIIQNCGTNAVKLLYADSGHASASQFHQILRAGSAQDDGNGGVVQVICSSRVTAIGGDGGAVRLAVTRIEAPEAT